MGVVHRTLVGKLPQELLNYNWNEVSVTNCQSSIMQSENNILTEGLWVSIQYNLVQTFSMQTGSLNRFSFWLSES